MQDAQQQPAGNGSHWPVMIAIFFGSFVSILNISTVNVAVPVLQTQFQADLGTIQWTITGFMLAMGTIAPVTGYLGERFSYKRVFLFALIGFTLTSGLCAAAWDAGSLIAFRVLQGAFSGLIMPATMTIIYQIIPKPNQPMAVSLWSMSAMLAPAIGPTLSGWLLQHWSWEWLFLLNVPFGLAAIVLVARYIPFYRLEVPKSFDSAGLLAAVVGTSALLVSLGQAHNWGWGSWQTLSLLSLGVVSLVLFVWRELSVATPILNFRVLKDGPYTLTLIITSIVNISLYSGTFLTPVFLQNIQHVSPMDTGLILLPSSVAMAMAMPLVGKLYGKIGPRWLVTVGCATLAVGTLALSRLSVDVSHAFILWWMIVRNLGIAMVIMPASNAGMEQIPRQMAGHASSMNNWVRNVLGSFAIAVFTSMLALRTESHATELVAGGEIADPKLLQSTAYTAGINDVFLVATLIACAALPLCFWVAGRPRSGGGKAVVQGKGTPA